MKIKGLFLVFALAIVFTSCKKDEEVEEKDESTIANDLLQGSWVATSIIINDDEVLGDSAIFQSYEMTYKSIGDYNGTIVIDSEIFGESESDTINYNIDEFDPELLIWTIEEEKIFWKLILTEQMLKISGTDANGQYQEVSARKK